MLRGLVVWKRVTDCEYKSVTLFLQKPGILAVEVTPFSNNKVNLMNNTWLIHSENGLHVIGYEICPHKAAKEAERVGTKKEP